VNELALPPAPAPFLEDLEGDALVLFHFSDLLAPRGHLGTVDWYLCGAVSRLLRSGRLAARPPGAALFTPRGKFRVGQILVLGLGPRRGMSQQDLYRASYEAAGILARLRAQTIHLDLPYPAFPRRNPLAIRRNFLEGFVAEYRRLRGTSPNVHILPPKNLSPEPAVE
jgi:hypothetical protein